MPLWAHVQFDYIIFSQFFPFEGLKRKILGFSLYFYIYIWYNFKKYFIVIFLGSKNKKMNYFFARMRKKDFIEFMKLFFGNVT